MHGEFFLLEQADGSLHKAARLPLGQTAGRNEAWLRDTLFEHPDILPIDDIEPAFGPLIPLCMELRTEAGPLDLCFINGDGRLTLVECKLWRNPEARRKVVAQVLDYARAISRWSYADLQRQVSTATGKKGNVAFEVVKARFPDVVEHRFIDAATRAMREGRFLLIIAGDGIREDIGGLTDLINRNAASAFSLGLVEVALFDVGADKLAVQPRVIARTHLIERNVVVLGGQGDAVLVERDFDMSPAVLPSDGAKGTHDAKQEEHRRWWQPVLDAPLDDPEQDAPQLRWPNNVRLQLPWPRTWVTGYRSMKSGGKLGVFATGAGEAFSEFWRSVGPSAQEQVLSALPKGSSVNRRGAEVTIAVDAPTVGMNDDEMRHWLTDTINTFVNALRPAMTKADPERF